MWSYIYDEENIILVKLSRFLSDCFAPEATLEVLVLAPFILPVLFQRRNLSSYVGSIFAGNRPRWVVCFSLVELLFAIMDCLVASLAILLLHLLIHLKYIKLFNCFHLMSRVLENRKSSFALATKKETELTHLVSLAYVTP
jgi:hypothetical protein